MRQRCIRDAAQKSPELTVTQWIGVGLLGKNSYDFDYKVVFSKLSTSEASGTGAFVVGPDMISVWGVVTICKPTIYAALAERRAA